MTIVGLILTAIFGFLLTSSIPVKGVNTVFIAFMIALAITTVLPLIHRRFEILRIERAFITSAVTVVFTYVIIFRPLLVSRPGLANLIDWVIVLIMLLKVNSAVKRYVVIEEEAEFEEFEFKREEIVEKIERAKNLFISRGVKSPLIAVLAEVLVSSGFRTEDIAKVISVILSCRDEGIPRFAFGWEKRIIERRNRKRREEALKRVEEMIGGVGVGLKGVQQKVR